MLVKQLSISLVQKKISSAFGLSITLGEDTLTKPPSSVYQTQIHFQPCDTELVTIFTQEQHHKLVLVIGLVLIIKTKGGELLLGNT